MIKWKVTTAELKEFIKVLNTLEPGDICDIETKSNGWPFSDVKIELTVIK